MEGRRLPFQTRVFPIFFFKLFAKVPWLAHLHAHAPAGSAAYQGRPLFFLNLGAFAAAAYFTQKLYSRLTERGLLRFLVFPVLLYTAIWTYVIHSEANFSYPYDLTSLAFFTAGLFFLYEKRFLPLLLVVALGTTNRETTLFLIVLFIIDAACSDGQTSRFQLRSVPWTKVAILSVTWLIIKLSLARHFGGNDASESFLAHPRQPPPITASPASRSAQPLWIHLAHRCCLPPLPHALALPSLFMGSPFLVSPSSSAQASLSKPASMESFAPFLPSHWCLSSKNAVTTQLREELASAPASGQHQAEREASPTLSCVSVRA